MKILYSIQATGNGHISRAMELLPYIKEFGEVDLFLSGGNSSLELDAPIKYRSRGFSLFYNCNGGLDYWQMMKGFQPIRLRQEIRDLPVEKYDLVLNDFEYITAAACAKKKVRSINYGHQASFMSANTPRPDKRSAAGEWVLKNYAKADSYVGLHFSSYDDFIFTPVIKKSILEAVPNDKNFITVYLPSYCEPQLQALFQSFPDHQFEIFSGQCKSPRREKNVQFLPVSKNGFNESLINCTGIITGGGFETPAEAIHLGKKIISIPIRSQYEQLCNGAALKEMGVPVLDSIDENFKTVFNKWINDPFTLKLDYSRSTEESLNAVFANTLSESIAV